MFYAVAHDNTKTLYFTVVYYSKAFQPYKLVDIGTCSFKLL